MRIIIVTHLLCVILGLIAGKFHERRRTKLQGLYDRIQEMEQQERFDALDKKFKETKETKE